MKKILSNILRGMLKVMKWFFIILALFLISLLFREQALPRSWLDAITERLSTAEMQIRCESASLGLLDGVTLRGLRVYDTTKTNVFSHVASAVSVSVNPIMRRVRITGANYPRLFESYYLPDYQECHEPLVMDLPDLPTFRLELNRPNILGLAPETVTARVNIKRNYISFDEVHVDWPGGGQRIAEDGYFRIDLAKQRAHGEVRGLATTAHIRPLMLALDIPSAMPYYDAFTEIPSPVNAAGDFDVNLINNDFRMILDLRPELGKYNGVAMARAQGKLDLLVKTRGEELSVDFGVDLPVALDPRGRQLGGVLGLQMTNDVVRIDINATSKLMLPDIIRIVDVFEPETLDFIQCETAPEITAGGHIGTSIDDIDWHSIVGAARFWKGSVFGFQTRSASLDWALERDTLTLTNVRVTGKNGGEVQGGLVIKMPGFDENAMTFETSATYRNGHIDELADIFGIDAVGRDGIVNAEVEVTGPLATNVASRLNGRGAVKVTDGRLLQMNIFAGLTKLLAEHVPGVDYIVNQSQASFDFTVENGVLHTENFFIEGGLLSIKGWGTYDIGADKLDFNVRVQFLKNESMLGTIVHPVTLPFTKLLLEFKATGSITAPQWDYISVLDRIF